MERVLPDPEVKRKLADLAVGLASDCDRPEADVNRIMRDNLANARTLPFVGFVTYDGKWIAGFSGFKRKGDFLKVLNEVEKSPHLQASEAVRKKLAKIVERAEKAAARSDWKAVLKEAGKAAKTRGRCPEREAMAAIERKARDWAEARFATVARMAREGGDLTEARKLLGEVRREFSREPEGDVASEGLKALTQLDRILDREKRSGEPETELRKKKAERFEDTRWAALFVSSGG